MLARIVEILGMGHRGKIGRGRFVSGPQPRTLTHEQRTGAVGQEQALVGIEGQRIGAPQAAQDRAQLRT